MASRFTALEVRSGEAFLLETRQSGKDWTILMDSGRRCAGTRALANAIETTLNEPSQERRNRIDVAVCTHNDIDHSGGFCSFFKHWIDERDGSIGEIWLPGRWLQTVERGLADPNGYAGALIEDFDGLTGAEGLEGRDFEELIIEECEVLLRNEADEGAPEPPDPDLPPGRREDLGWPIDPRSVDGLATRVAFGAGPSRRFASALISRRPNSRYLRYIAAAGKAILEIAEQAIIHHVPVRWFEAAPVLYGRLRPLGGIAGLLEPVTATETPHGYRGFASLRSNKPLVNLHLTLQNVESLVYVRPENETEPGVLFTADSRLARGVKGPEAPGVKRHFPIPDRPIVITVPHHGSKSNDYAIRVLRRWLRISRPWSRKFGLFPNFFVRHGSEKMPLAMQLRNNPRLYCTRCKENPRCSGSEYNSVQLLSEQSVWTPINGTICHKAEMDLIRKSIFSQRRGRVLPRRLSQ